MSDDVNAILAKFYGSFPTRDEVENYPSEAWRLLVRLVDALEASVQAPADPYCREESCRYRHWTSGSMPTHRRGAHCPEPSVEEAAQSVQAPHGRGHWECDCVPDLGPSHCHPCSEVAGREVPWSETYHGVVQAPAVDREALARLALEGIESGRYDDGQWEAAREYAPVAYRLADHLIASGILQDAAEVEARGLEAAAEDWPREQFPAAWMRGRAAAIREGRA